VSVLVETFRGRYFHGGKELLLIRLIKIGEKAMSTIIKFVAPADLLFQPGHEKSAAATQKEKATEPGTIGEPERRFWEPPVRGASQTRATIEIFVLVVFLLLALAGILSCSAELYYLLKSDALGHVAAKAVNGGL
jgi:hypothetical protein